MVWFQFHKIQNLEKNKLKKMRNNFKILRILPFALFSLIIFISALVLYQLKNEPKNFKSIKSQLIGKNIPEILIPEINYFRSLNGKQSLNFKKFQNQIFAVNFFASWCAPCRIESPIIEELNKIIPVVGVAYKDKFNDTKSFLNDFGNPYKMIGLDEYGKVAIEWGVYGVPETFLINKKGKIIYRHAGPLLYNTFKYEVLPLIQEK